MRGLVTGSQFPGLNHPRPPIIAFAARPRHSRIALTQFACKMKRRDGLHAHHAVQTNQSFEPYLTELGSPSAGTRLVELPVPQSAFRIRMPSL